jgi:hypothetical protein
LRDLNREFQVPQGVAFDWNVNDAKSFARMMGDGSV